MGRSARTTARVVVLGGGFAGILAARRIARLAPGGTRVLLVNAADSFLERVRLHQVAAAQPLARPRITELLDGTEVGFLRGTALALDPGNQRLEVRDDANAQRSLAYDALVYAAGSTVDAAAIPGGATHALSVADEPRARALARRAAECAARRGHVVVCGGGLTGVELATELAEAFPALRITLATRGAVGAGLSDAARAYLQHAFARLRIATREGVTVTALEPREVHLEGHAPIGCDLAVWAGSFRAPPLAREAGLAVNSRDQVLLDRAMRSVSHPTVFAAGDAAVPAEPDGVPIRMACATAMPMAVQVARSVAMTLRGRAPDPFWFAYAAQFVSLGRRDAIAQLVRVDDAPTRWVFTGQLAAWIKDATFRMNLFALRTGFYPWTRRPPWPLARALLAVSTRPPAP